MEYRVWIRDKDGGFQAMCVDREEWKVQADKKRQEELDAKKEGKTIFFGSSAISVNVYPEGQPAAKKQYLITDVVRANPSEQDGVGDMTGLTFLEEATMLHNMRFRFGKDHIYSSISKVICATNPYQWLEIYSEETMAKYRGARVEGLPPHIFGTAERAYTALKRGKNQSMICCGESGSGKTESTKLLMRYLATANKGSPHESKSDQSVAPKVLQANPILESFGNASTLRNNNSSRFAKFTKLFFDTNASLVSADLVTFLLEKSRVVSAPMGERSYHSFYLLFTIPAEFQKEIKVNLHLEGRANTDFAYIKNNIQIGKIDDHQFCLEMLEGMKTLGFANDLRDGILRALAGVLYLGNILPFDKTEYKAGKDMTALCDLLGVKVEDMVYSLTTREIVTKQDKIKKPRDPAEFLANRDTMAKALYHGLFELLVVKINDAFVGGPSKAGKWIGVLDVFGFEHFEHNSFEQLCINFCNEKLQQYFNTYIISSEQEEYEKEGIQWSTLDTRDRAGCLRLLEGLSPAGIFPLLDSANAQSQDHVRFLATVLKEHRYNRFLYKPRPVGGRFLTEKEKQQQELLEISFGVKHYAAAVVYDTSELLVKNADRIDPATIALFAGSSAKLVSGLLKGDADPNKKKESVGTFFVNQLDALVKTLTATEPHFVRCINPNSKKQKQFFDLGYVSPQLVNGGLVEAVRMLKLGYPTRYQYTLFFTSFKPLLKVVEDSKDEFDASGRYYAKKVVLVKSKDNTPRYINMRDFCEGLLIAFGLQRDQYQCGITKMFFRAGLQELVEEVLARASQLDKIDPKTIRKIEKWLIYKRITRLSGSAKFLGKYWLYTKRQTAARNLQLAVRSHLNWDDRVHWKENRQKAANSIGSFFKWCASDRQLLHMRRSVEAIVTQIREEKAAKREGERNKPPPAHILADLAAWIESVVHQPVISSLFPALATGELLCDLIMAINKTIVLDGVHRGKKQLFFARDNLQKATKGLMTLRCPANTLFSPDDLLSTVSINYKKVTTCLQWLASTAFFKYEIPLPKFMMAKLEAGGDLQEDEEESFVDTGAVSGDRKRRMKDDSDDEEEGDEDEDEEKKLRALIPAGQDVNFTSSSSGGSGGSGGSGKLGIPGAAGAGGSGDRSPLPLSPQQEAKNAVSALEKDFARFSTAMIAGTKFKQYDAGRKVMKRFVRLLPPRAIAEKKQELTYERLIQTPDLRLIIATKSALVSMINVKEIVSVFAGKRDGGKCFPRSEDSSAADDSVAPDDRCLVILTKKRTIGLEAQSKFVRDFWVFGLEWCMNLYRAAVALGETGAGADDVTAGMELDPMLLSGSFFTKHGLKGVSRRWIKCTGSHVYWLKKEDAPLSECVDPIEWSSVSEILQGKQTLMFSRARARDVSDSLCLSIVYRADNRSLDLVADSEESAFEWYSAMNGYLQELKEKFAEREANKGMLMEQELAGLRAALQSEQEAHLKTVQSLGATNAVTDEELSQIEEQRAALNRKYETKESEMERMKAMMAEEKEQLMHRIEDLHVQVKELTGQLDTALTQNQIALTQLQEARNDQLELELLRSEMKKVREERAQQAQEISTVLALFNTKFTQFHDGLTKKPESSQSSGDPSKK